jgi:hypothetical protein
MRTVSGIARNPSDVQGARGELGVGGGRAGAAGCPLVGMGSLLASSDIRRHRGKGKEDLLLRGWSLP